MNFYNFLLFIIFFPYFFTSQTAGQFIEGSQDIKIPFTITQFSTKHGLPQSQVTDILSKKNGDLIISTANGIVEYNGYEFKSISNDLEYKKNIYTKLLLNENHNKLFGEQLDGNLYQILPNYKLLYPAKASTLKGDSLYVMDKMGNILVANTNDLKFLKIATTKLKQISCLYYYSNTFLIGTRSGLYKYNIKTQGLKKILTGEFIDFKLNQFNDLIYVLGLREVYVLKDTIATKILDMQATKKKAVCQDIAFVDEQVCYVATTSGLYEITEDYIDCYTKKSDLPSQFIQSLYYNVEENCLFAGTGEKGLLKLQLKNCYSFSSAQGFGLTSSLSSIIKTKNGEVLVSETGGTIYHITADTVIPYTEIKKTYSCLSEINDLIFAGTWGEGIILLKDRKQIGRLEYPINLPSNVVHASFKDSEGKIWIGTQKGIASGTTIDNIKPILSGFIKHTVISFYQLKNGNLCIGGTDGVYILNKKKEIIKHIGQKEGIEGREVRSFYEDLEGKLWIGTYDGGLYCYFKNKVTSINKLKNCKLDNDVFCIAKDALNYLNITSNHGLWRIKEKDLNDFYYSKKEYLIPFYYGEETGILNTEFNGGFQNNYLKTKSDHFYFPTLQGVVVVSPEQPIQRKLTPTIDRIFINDTLTENRVNILNENTYSIQFDFSSVNFLTKYNVYYQYKLESETPAQWSNLKKNNSVIFKLLPAGNYTFSVRAVNAFNDDNPTAATYMFKIKPHFYETVWFKLFAAILFITLTIVVGRIRVQGYRKKAEEKEFYKRSMAELELKAIQAQLNPHFIFNCLNTIKYFILDQDFEKANKGLTHFSKMLRDTINNSDQPTISIKNEIIFLTDYLELEKMRLLDKLDFSINCAISNQNISIPSMLIQPHVENAMKHGIANLIDKKGSLTIDFIKHFLFIEIRIRDNGIGRVAASKINKRPNYVSKGISLSAEKSEAFNKINDTAITTEIVDLIDKNNIAEGTLVIIKIPYYDDSNN